MALRLLQDSQEIFMPIQIGAKTENSFANPIGLMADCHRRIKKFLSLMITVMRQTHGGPLQVNQRDAFETALLYFAEAAPKHTLDEEESLFPRIRKSSDDGAKSLDQLEQEHYVAELSHLRVNYLGEKWMREGSLSTEDAVDLATALGKLSAIYKKHIHMEENQVFPLASKVLSNADVSAIGREMALRRNLNIDTLI
jgi:hemerythrin-like domain-containing protein